MTKRDSTRSKRTHSLAWALRALRQPLVALCAVLMVANLVTPVASFGAATLGDETFWCHGGAPQARGDAGAPAAGHGFQHCCFSAAMALVGEAGLLTLPATPRPLAALPFFPQRARTARIAGTQRIRAPPLA